MPRAVADVEQRDLLLALGAVALLDDRRGGGSILHRLALGAQFGVDLAHFLALLAQRAGLLPFGGLLAAAAEQRAAAGQRITPCPIRSITASQDRPVASVTDTSNSASRNRLPPSRPKPL